MKNSAEMDISQSQALVNQGVQPASDIETAIVTSFTLSVTDPDDADLSFISSLEIWVEAPDLDPVMVRFTERIPRRSSGC